MGLDLGTISASVGLNTTPLAAGVVKAKGMFAGLDASLSKGGMKNAEGGLAGLGNQLKSLAGLGGGASGAISGVGASLGTLGTVGLVAGAVVALGAAFYGCAKAAEEEQKINAQTNAVIASTGGVANVTASHVDNLGNKLASISGTSHDVIKSAENIMLTFRNVANQTGKNNDIFDQAIIATEDMSIALGKDLNDSAIKVGKALADPAKGLTALRRYGVIFTDQQVAQAKAMQANNNLMGAQKIVLAELNKEFGGSAAAKGNTLSGVVDKLKDSWDRLEEALGKSVLPQITSDLQVFGSALRGISAIKLPEMAGWANRIASDMVNPISLVKDMQKLYTGLKNIMVKPDRITIDTTEAVSSVKNLQKVLNVGASSAGAGTTKVKIDTSTAIMSVDQLTDAFNKLKGASTATWIASEKGIKTLTNQLANSGLGGITQKEIDDMLQAMANSKHGIRASGYAMMQQILDAEGWASPQIRDAAAGMMTSISDQIEQAQNLGPVTGQQVAKIVAAVLAGGPPLDAAGQQLMQQLGAIIAGTPLPTQPVTVTPPPEGSAEAIMAGVQTVLSAFHPTITPVVGPPGVGFSPVRAFSSVDAAGAYIASRVTGSVQTAMNTMPVNVTVGAAGGGMAGAAATGLDALNASFAALMSTVLPGWSTDVDNATAGFAHMEEAIMNLTNQNGNALLSWRNMRGELDKTKASVDAYQAAIDASNAKITAYQATLDARNAKLTAYQDKLNSLSTMKIAGEGKASDKSFNQDEKSKKLQLDIMKAEDAHNYALAAKLTLQKEAVDRQKEEADLQTGLTYDPQHRALEKLLDPLGQQEMSYTAIAAGIVKVEKNIAAEEKAIKAVEKQIAKEQVGLEKLKKLHDAASLAVENYSKTVDAMAANFLAHYRDMQAAAEKLNSTVASSPNKALTIYEKQMTEMARKHKSFYSDMIGSAFKLNQAVTGGGVTASAAGGYTPVSGGASPIIQVNSYTTLDGKVLTKTVSRYQGGQANSRAMSGGRY